MQQAKFYSCNKSSVMRNACNNPIVIHAVKKVSIRLITCKKSSVIHTIKHISFFCPHESHHLSFSLTHQNLHSLSSHFFSSKNDISLLLSSITTLSISYGSSPASPSVLALRKSRDI